MASPPPRLGLKATAGICRTSLGCNKCRILLNIFTSKKKILEIPHPNLTHLLCHVQSSAIFTSPFCNFHTSFGKIHRNILTALKGNSLCSFPNTADILSQIMGRVDQARHRGGRALQDEITVHQQQLLCFLFEATHSELFA